MKKYILILILSAFISEIKAQYYGNNAPCPMLPNIGNSWDWRASAFTVYMQRYPNGYPLPSPFLLVTPLMAIAISTILILAGQIGEILTPKMAGCLSKKILENLQNL